MTQSTTADQARIAELEAQLAARDGATPVDERTPQERVNDLARMLARRVLAGDELHTFLTELDYLTGINQPEPVDEPAPVTYGSPAEVADASGQVSPAQPPAPSPAAATPGGPRPGSPFSPGATTPPAGGAAPAPGSLD